MSEFSMLGLDGRIIKNLDHLGIDTPTPIQARGIPMVLEGRDVMGLAQTGTGKTAAFSLPIIHNLLQKGGKPLPRHTKALVLSPTRELANQIAQNIAEYVKYTPLKVNCVVGGQPIHIQRRKLEAGSDILVATPGRLLDLIDRNAIILDETYYLVLDEADQMLDLGFIEPLKQIAKLVNPHRQTLLFSATMPKQMAELSKTYLDNPVRLQVAAPGKAADKVRQSVHFISQRAKTTLLKKCLNENPDDISLIFVRTKRGADKLAHHLTDHGFKVDSIHGDKRQRERDRAIKKFKAGDITILVATDVAARGIDIPSVSHVYNYDLPEQADNYVHRIGRTARAGREGDAVAFCSPSEVPTLREIERLMKIRIEIASGEPPEDEVIEEDSRNRSRFRGRGRGGRSGGGRSSGQGRGGDRSGGRAGHNKSGFEARKAKGKKPQQPDGGESSYRPEKYHGEDEPAAPRKGKGRKDKNFSEGGAERRDDRKGRKSWGERQADPAGEGKPFKRRSKGSHDEGGRKEHRRDGGYREDHRDDERRGDNRDGFKRRGGKFNEKHRDENRPGKRDRHDHRDQRADQRTDRRAQGDDRDGFKRSRPKSDDKRRDKPRREDSARDHARRDNRGPDRRDDRRDDRGAGRQDRAPKKGFKNKKSAAERGGNFRPKRK